MANDTNRLILELKARGVKLTKAQLKQLDNQVKASKAGMMAMGAGLVAATAAFYALGKALSHTIKVGKEFEQSMANLKAISGASGAEMLKLEKTARNLGATTKFTASEVGGLQTEFAKLGFTVKEIENATAATLNLAAATGADLAEAAGIAGNAIRAFGLNASQTGMVTDVMAKSFSSSALDMQKFTDSMTYVAPVAKMAGVSIQGTTAMLGRLANAGISGSMAGTQLRKILLEAGQAGTKLAKRLGGPITSMEDFQEKLQNLVAEGFDPMAEAEDLVGTRAVAAFGVLLDGLDTVDDLTTSLDNAAGSAERMASIQLDTLEGKLTILNSAWEGFGVAIYDYFEEPLKSATVALTDFLGSMTEALEISMAEKLQEEQDHLNALALALQNNIAHEDKRKIIIDELRAKYPDFLKGLSDEAVDLKNIKDRLEEANAAYTQKILLVAQQDLINKAGKEYSEIIGEQLDLEVKLMKAFGELTKQTQIAYDESKTFSENLRIQQGAMEDLGLSTDGAYVALVKWIAKALLIDKGVMIDGVENLLGLNDDLADSYDKIEQWITQIQIAEEKSGIALKDKSEYVRILNDLLKEYGIELENVDEIFNNVNGGGNGNGGDDEDGLNAFQKFFGASEEAISEEHERMNEMLGYYGDFVSQASSLISGFTQHAVKEAKKRAKEEIDEINKKETKELEALKKTMMYKNATDEQKAIMEEELQARYELAREQEEEAANKRIKEAFKIEQKAKVAQVVMSTARAVAKAWERNPHGFGLPGSALAAIMGAAQIALKNKQEPPVMAQGGFIGVGQLHPGGGTPIIAERGEFVINRAAVENIGIEALDRINAGEGGQEITVNINNPIMTEDFVSEEIVPHLQEALRRGSEL